MGWNDKGRVNAEEILGMKPEELKTKLESAASKEDLNAAIEAGVAPFRTAFEEIKQQIQSISTPAAPPADAPDTQLEYLTDPQKFVDSRVTPVAQAAIETRADVAEMRARQNPKFAEAFRQFGPELIESAKKNFNPQTRAGDNFWEFHIQNVIGKKTLSGEIKAGNMPSLLGSSSGGGSSASERERDYSEVDPEVGSFLKERGITPERVTHISNLMKNGKIRATSEVGRG